MNNVHWTSSIQNFCMFKYCVILTELDFHMWNQSRMLNRSRPFVNSKLDTYLNAWDTGTEQCKNNTNCPITDSKRNDCFLFEWNNRFGAIVCFFAQLLLKFFEQNKKQKNGTDWYFVAMRLKRWLKTA